MMTTNSEQLAAGDMVVYPHEVGDIPACASATIIEDYGLGSYLVELANGRRYYAHKGEIARNPDQATIDALVAALEEILADKYCAPVLGSLRLRAERALALARGEK